MSAPIDGGDEIEYCSNLCENGRNTGHTTKEAQDVQEEELSLHLQKGERGGKIRTGHNC